MRDRSRRDLLTGAAGGLGGAGVLGYSWRWASRRRHDIRLRPITLVNSNTNREDVYVRIHANDGYESHETITLEAAETDRANADGSTTTRILDDPWTDTPRAYALTAVSSVSLRNAEPGWPLTNEEIRGEMAEDDPDADCAEIVISVFGSMAVHVSASVTC